MNREYFKNCTDEQIMLYARYDCYTQNNSLSKSCGVNEAMAYLADFGNIGDTSLEVLRLDETAIVFLSKDSGITVELTIPKENGIYIFEKATTKEL